MEVGFEGGCDVEVLVNKLNDLELTITRVVEKVDDEVLNQIEDLKSEIEKLKNEKLNKSEFDLEIRKMNLELENISKALVRNEEREKKVDEKLEKIALGQDKLFKYGFAGFGTMAVVFTLVGNITGTKIDVVSIFLSLVGIGG